MFVSRLVTFRIEGKLYLFFWQKFSIILKLGSTGTATGEWKSKWFEENGNAEVAGKRRRRWKKYH